MIPPILHQTWKTDELPEQFRAWSETWLKHNPGWTRMFWTDRTLLEFVGRHYPDFLETFCSYPYGIMRADAARYLLLHHFGGVYADIDCECVAPFDPIMDEDRVVLCCEPAEHFLPQIHYRRLPYMLFNGTMASPAGHPFWPHLISYLPALVHAKEVLDGTGPCVLTSAQLSFPDQDLLSVRPCALFAPIDAKGMPDASVGEGSEDTLSIHHWAGTWLTPPRRKSVLNTLKRHYYRTKYRLTRGAQLSLEEAKSTIDPAALERSPPAGENVAVMVPLRDAAEHIASFLEAIGSLDYPKDRLKLVFCEGDSRDGSWEKLNRLVEPLRDRYRDIVLLQHHLGTPLDRKTRQRPRLQRVRRSGLAKVRNQLIKKGLDESDDWALWIDIDVWQFPADIIQTLRETGRRIVVPNCRTCPGGPSFDLNNFVTIEIGRDYRYYRNMVKGLHQPPWDFAGRRSLSDLGHLERVELDGVGGTMLLVDAALHRGGLVFPEKPYKDLVETEGFGVLAKDLGVPPLGLPRVEILHVPW